MCILHSIPAFSIDCTIKVRWTKPTTGTPAVRYVVQANVSDSGFKEFSRSCTDTFFVFTQPRGSTIKVKVAGVDSLHRQGPFSADSVLMVFDCH